MFNNTPANAPQQTANLKSNKKTMPLILMLIAVLTIINFAFFIFRKGNDVAPVQQALAEKEQAFSELETTYKAAQAQLDSLKALMPNNSEAIEDLQADLEAKKDDIAQNIRLKGDLEAARREIEELVKQKDNAILEVSKLKERVRDLDEKVLTLSNEKQRYESDKQQYETGLNELRNQLDEAQSAKAALVAEKTRLEQDNYNLNSRAEATKFLSVDKIDVSPVGTRKGKEKETNSHKNINKIKICFAVGLNAMVPAGEEKFHIKITDPSGSTLYREDQGSGVATSKPDETDFRYTTIAVCRYEAQATTACGYWQVNEGELSKGKYMVEIFNRGRSVGTSEFKVK